jgi:hypothetical protein
MAASATWALKAGVWFRRGRRLDQRQLADLGVQHLRVDRRLRWRWTSNCSASCASARS